ncbi:MAG: polysaccharide deacetylase family protein [Armatimonadota bacterium]|nr:polysaccharide deacetylase family protein [Armatimonadota bacterium]
MSPTVILGFDMETDVGSWTPFYEGLVHGAPKLLEVLARHGISSTFFFVGEAAQKHPEIVRMALDAGHEIGCHTLYHETVGDEIIPIPGIRTLLPEEVHHRLEVATDIVEQVAGRKMLSFRAPRLFGSTAMVNALEDLGYAADASYPLYFYKDRLVPYHPSREDWTTEGDLQILEIPNFADMTIDTADEYGRDRDQWPLFRTEGADALMVHIDNMLRLYEQEGLPAVLCFYMHPWEFHEMPQGPIHYGEGTVIPDPFIVKNTGAIALKELDRLLAALKERDAVFQTCEGVAESRLRTE